ncbi:DUF1254 domain-containing protein [Deltaproteobacteria bacterium Smac51]|nr:DUF1254 domain-containing protein [Deltaproteobacteria bacterium Smac51]
MPTVSRLLFLLCILALGLAAPAGASETPAHYRSLIDIPFVKGYPSMKDIDRLKGEIALHRAVQAYIWALPALNLTAMKEAKEKQFGAGYNVMIVWKERLNAKTLITTPNMDMIYGMTFFDLHRDGPMVVEVPPGIQGIIDDSYQRPPCSAKQIDGKTWCGDVGLPGPDKGEGAKYLVIPPDYEGDIPDGYLVYRSRTYGVMLLWRAFYQDPKQLEKPVKTIEQTVIYPLGGKDSAKAMSFPDASGVPIDMLYPKDGSAFDMLARYIDSEYVDEADMEMRGILATLGIVKGQPFQPDARQRELLDLAAKLAAKYIMAMSYTPQAIVPESVYYKDRRWLNVFPGNPFFTAPTFNFIDARAGYFINAFSASPAMAASMENLGAKYPVAYMDADGDFLDGGQNYMLKLPKDIPAALFWSVAAYDSLNASGLDNGQPFPAINAMDQPGANSDGSIDIYFGPESPGAGKNWLKTVPGKGYFVILRLYGPKKEFFDQSWKPGDFEKRN